MCSGKFAGFKVGEGSVARQAVVQNMFDFGRSAVLCREENQTLHAKVGAVVFPLQILEAELKVRGPLRGMSRPDLDEGRIVRLQCSRANEAYIR